MTTTDLPTTTTALRKLAQELGLKGMGSANKATLLPAITAELERRAAAEAVIEKAGKAPKLCAICGKRRPTSKNGKDFRDQCDPCHVEAGWENTHSDGGHADILAVEEEQRTDVQRKEIDGCWVCFPELNRAKRDPRPGQARAGQVVVAKGNKAEVFKAAAEAAEYRVDIETNDANRTVATATCRDGSWIQLVWNGAAYDYPNSSAKVNGKERKVRNLAEALRLLM
ncbi:hypothetical protein [Paractinoplanes durhamensis]|uniref:Rho termination factor N-terminal domain-containing protein n=1 Tax=Paractinoplanes durhamensis TaxID=113563 RepID=A0ABQ3ZBU3_9ACTN|nr:hypothetical protein [Actinoplanes durhamensis]GIE07303.1 hypothetical protein Adu01nite_86530 [Actinoplanes durhamensis]